MNSNERVGGCLVAALLVLGMTASRASATTTTSSGHVSGFLVNSRTGNTDSFTYDFHRLTSRTTSPSGTVHVDEKISASDFKLEDPTVGKCQGQFSFDLHTNTTTSSLPFEEMFHETDLDIESPGGGNNEDVGFNAHITINPDGTVTSSFTNFEATCQ